MTVESTIADALERFEQARTETDSIAALVELGDLRPDREHGTAIELVAAAFRRAADRSEWSRLPLVVSDLFETLVRRPRILDAYRLGVEVAEIEERFGVSSTAVYSLLGDYGVERTRTRPGRPSKVDRAAVRLAAFLGADKATLAEEHECHPRTIQRILTKRVVAYQPWVDAVATAQPGEALRGAWNRFLDELADYGPEIGNVDEPDWPTDRNRRALVAAALAYRLNEHDHALPAWLGSPNLVAETLTSPVPEYIELVAPLTPPVVAHYNVALDEASFASV